MSGRRLAVVAAALTGLAGAAGCSASSRENVKETAKTVLTLQTGTVSELKARRGTGPFQEHDAPPDEMLRLVEGVLRSKVVAVFPEPRASLVVAKERAGEDALDDAYAPAFRTAVVVFVHPVEGRPDRARTEVHAIRRGPFHGGVRDWEREVPPLLEAAVAARRAPLAPLR